MAWALESVQLTDGEVSIRSYEPEYFTKIAESINDPSGWFATKFNIDTPEKIVSMLESHWVGLKNGVCNPLVYFVGNEVAGITRFMRIEASNKTLEIGGTWVAPKWRKTFANTQVKYLLLRHCFETLGAERVEFRVDTSNIESQRAVLRIGACLEGRLRNRQITPSGKINDGFIFSIVKPEWDRVKTQLLEMISNPLSKPQKRHCLRQFETRRLILRRYDLTDADGVFDLVDRNRSELMESFPKTPKELHSREVAEGYITDRLHQWLLGQYFCYGVFLKPSGQQVGQIQVKNINWEIPSAELGYFVDSRHRRIGIAREMIEACFQHCLSRHEFKRVFLRILHSNQASLSLAENLGFTREGLHRNEFLSGTGKVSDLFYFSKTFNPSERFVSKSTRTKNSEAECSDKQ